MTPFLFAAALAIAPGTQVNAKVESALAVRTAPAAPPILSFVLPPGASLPPGAHLTPYALGSSPVACDKLDSLTVAPDGVPLLKRLDKLPTGLLEHAVWRTVGGCPVREVVINGQTMYLTSPSPKIVRLDPSGFGRVEH